MICRLCLNNFNGDHAVPLFGGKHREETENVQLIAKYFQLNLTSDDQISIHICSDCCDRLQDFHNFWLYVADKQSDLENHDIFLCREKLITSNAVKNIVVISEQPDNKLPIEDEVLSIASSSTLNEETDFSVESDFSNSKLCAEFDEELESELSAADLSFESNTEIGFELDGCQTPIENCMGDMKAVVTDLESASMQAAYVGASQKSPPEVAPPKQRLENVSKTSEQHTSSSATDDEDIINDFLRLSCDICKEPAATYDALCKHFKMEHKSTAYVKCCGDSYENRASLLEHIAWHKNPSIFKCDICSLQMRSKATLLSHKRHFHSNLKKLPGPLSCSLCNKTYRYHSFFTRHLKTHMEHICVKCGKSFNRPSALRHHVRTTHEDRRPFSCTICDNKYKTKVSFNKHMRLHEGIVPPKEQCTICKEWFKDKTDLRSHVNIHNKKTFKCKYCERVCPSSKALSKHTVYMHKKQKVFKCDVCGKAFKTEWILEEHTATHTGKQLYICNQCGKQCRSRSNMYVHVKRKHFEYWQKTKKETKSRTKAAV